MEPPKIYREMSFISSEGNSIELKLYGDAESPIFSAEQIETLLGVNKVQKNIKHSVDGVEKCHIFVNGCDELGLTERGLMSLLTESSKKTAWLLICWVIRKRYARRQAAIYAAEVLRLQTHLLLIQDMKMLLLAESAAARVREENEALTRKVQIMNYLKMRMVKEETYGDFVMKGQSMLIDLKSQGLQGEVRVHWTIAILTLEMSSYFVNDEAINRITGIEKMEADSKYCSSGLYSVAATVLQEYLASATNSPVNIET